MGQEPVVHVYENGVEVGKPVGEEADETTKEGSAGLPPRGVGRTEDDERYAGVKTLALGGYASGLID
ncbi:hypothetical protein [Anaerosoma tenue]|uniref:hypothetical protein n=1 Tax=Anaerosoma tenue TaxID=2933588 RepID=UPI0022608A87|nr:hypothetical protein [Anaerosoma tenue]MCK8113969.1 hypothetical protein [Anaerosoma tenue]